MCDTNILSFDFIVNTKTSMTKSYAFYDVSNENDSFHIQCEWFNVKVDLDEDNSSDNVEYGIVTITNLQDYWQCSIDRDLLLDSFPVSNALINEQRNKVLTAAFLGEESLNGSKLEWKISFDKKEYLQMRLRTFDDDIPLTAGSFLLKKVPEVKYRDLHKLWFTNSAVASSTSTQINKALQQRITDITKTNNELKETIELMNMKESKNKFIMIDKFVQLLNHKKRKVYTLEQQVKTSNEKIHELEEQLKKRKRNDEDEDKSAEITIVKRQKTTKVEIQSLPLPVIDDSDDDFYDSDDMDCPQTVR